LRVVAVAVAVVKVGAVMQVLVHQTELINHLQQIQILVLVVVVEQVLMELGVKVLLV